MKRILLTTMCVAAISGTTQAGGWPTAALGSPLALVETLEPPGGDTTPEPQVVIVAPEVPEVVQDTPVPAVPVTRDTSDVPLEKDATTAKRQVLLAKRQVERAQREADTAANDAEVQFTDRLQGIVKRTGGDGRSLIIRGGDTDPKSLAAAEEDLAVMARILNKSLAKKAVDEHMQVMGVTIISGGDGYHNFLIDGYGAIFLLRANIPLQGGTAKVVEDKPSEPGNSTWDEAKQELYGTPRHPATRVRTWKSEFDSKKVDELKDALLEAMKNASNIRSLKDNEYVTVVVNSGNDGNIFTWSTSSSSGGMSMAPMAFGGGGFGSSGGGVGSAGGGSFGVSSSSGSSNGGGGSGASAGTSFRNNLRPLANGSDSAPVEVHAGGHNVTVASGSTAPHAAMFTSDHGGKGSTMTIRARKSDIDSFFKGKLNLEEFRKKAAIAIY